jgi:hypothetical protein
VSINGVEIVRDSLTFLLYKFTTFPPEACALGEEYENTEVLILVPSIIASVIVIVYFTLLTNL